MKMTHATTLRVWSDNKLCEVYCQKVTITTAVNVRDKYLRRPSLV